MPDVKALFFDLDGTLLDGVWTRYWPTIADQWTLGSLDGETVSTEAWRQTLAACGCDDRGISRAAHETHARYYRSSLRLYPDALELLSLLSGRYSLALITNGASDTQRTALGIVDLEKGGNALVISGEAGVAKPDPRDLRRGPS